MLLGGTWLLHPCPGRLRLVGHLLAMSYYLVRFYYLSDIYNLIFFCIVATPPSGTAEPLGLSLVGNSTNEATAARILALRQRLKLPPPGLSSKSVNPGTHLNTATLLAHEHGGGLPGESLIMVCWEVCH